MPQNSNEYLQLLSNKLLLGTITEQERTILDNWYADKPSEAAVWLLADDSKQALENRLLKNINLQLTPVKKLFPAWAKVAAAAAVIFVVVGLGISFFAQNKKQPQNKQFSLVNVDGQIRKVVLPDNSLVWLKGNSRLSYPEKFTDSTRNVELAGEALFEVTKDPKHPFIIQAGNYETRVLGTSFNIKENRANNSFKLIVLTGKVMVKASKAASKNVVFAPVFITPGNEFEASNSLQVARITTALTTSKTAIVQGTEYNMDFGNAGFEEIKQRIEKKFNIEINAADKAYQNCQISADLTDQSLENTLKVICAAIGAEYNIKNTKVTIAGGGCGE